MKNPSFLKRPMREGSLDTSKQSETSTPQLCDRKEEANKLQSKPFVPFISVNKESFGDGFYPPDLLSEILQKDAMLEIA